MDIETLTSHVVWQDRALDGLKIFWFELVPLGGLAHLVDRNEMENVVVGHLQISEREEYFMT